MALTRKQYALLEEIDSLLYHAPHLKQVTLTQRQWRLWQNILERVILHNDPRFDIERSCYRTRVIRRMGDEQP